MIGRTDGDLARALQPALPNAVLARPRVGGNTCSTGLDDNHRNADGAIHFQCPPTRQIQFGDDPAVATDHGFLGGAPLPDERKGNRDTDGGDADHGPVAGQQQVPPGGGDRSNRSHDSSRWRTRTRARPANSRASHSAMHTDRCWPPVQPMATVR